MTRVLALFLSTWCWFWSGLYLWSWLTGPDWVRWDQMFFTFFYLAVLWTLVSIWGEKTHILAIFWPVATIILIVILLVLTGLELKKLILTGLPR